MKINKDKIVKELIFKTSRSSGKGGQNVNKVESKVELFFSISTSALLSESDKKIIQNKLKNKINKEGQIYLSEESERSQLANKEKIIKKLIQLLLKATKKEKIRKPSIPTKASKIKKRISKELDSEKKRLRQNKNFI